MGSPHFIGMQRNKHNYFVYCHGGRRLSENGAMLYENYKTTEQVEELLAHGGMSYLEKTPEECHYYKNWKGKIDPGTTVTDNYGRPKKADGNEPCYLWKKDQWYYSPCDDEIWIPLEAVFGQEGVEKHDG